MENIIKIEGKITQEVIDTLINLMKEVIGENGVTVVLSGLEVEENASGRKIIYAFAESTTRTLGVKGAFATLRQVGRELSKVMMANHPRENWEHVLQTALNDLGFAQEIKRENNQAFICNCVFYSVLKANNQEPIQHSVCWAGWGFIEGFMKELEGIKGIQWKARDNENNRCKFDFIK